MGKDLFLSIALLLVVGAALLLPACGESEPTAKLETQAYTSSSLGFSLTVPSDWMTEEEGGTVTFGSPDDPIGIVVVSNSNLFGGAAPQVAATSGLGIYTSRFPDLETLSVDGSVGNLPYVARAESTLSRVVIVVDKVRTYQVLGAVANETFVDSLSVIESALETFQWFDTELDIQLKNGLSAFEVSNWDEAINHFTEAIRFDSANGGAFYYRASSYKEMSELDAAISDFNSALEIDREFVSAYVDRGNLYLRRKDYEKAISDYDKAIQLAPALVHGYKNRGLVNYDLGRYEEAVRDFTQTIELVPEDTAAYRYRGISYIRLGEETLALRDLNQSIALNANSEQAHFFRGVLYYALSRNGEALVDLQKVITMSSNPSIIEKAQELIDEIQKR